MGHELRDLGRIKQAYFVHAQFYGTQEEYNKRRQWCIDNLVGDFHHCVTGIHCYEGGDVLLFMGRWQNQNDFD